MASGSNSNNQPVLHMYSLHPETHIDRNPSRISSDIIIARLRRDCGLELEAVPESEDTCHIQLRLVQGALEKPVQLGRTLLRWLVPNLGCNSAGVIQHGMGTLIAFGRAQNSGIALGGGYFNRSIRRINAAIGLDQIGNSFLYEGCERILYPAIVLATPSIIVPRRKK